LGLDIRAMVAVGGNLGIGLEGSWFEQPKATGFSHAADTGHYPDWMRQREVLTGAVVRVGPEAIHLIAGVGGYACSEILDYPEGWSTTAPTWLPGFNVGIASSARRRPSVSVRVHHMFRSDDSIQSSRGRLIIFSLGWALP
jgi:hypothetical protein